MEHLSRVVEAFHKMTDSKHARRLGWGVTTAVIIWSLAQLIAAVAPNGLL